MTRPHLVLVEPATAAELAASELLPPAEAVQREPYVADWMVAEGLQAFAERRAARRARWALTLCSALILVAIVVVAGRS